MDLELAGLRVLVTGSSGGVGAAIAERLALEGCRVIVHGRREGPAAEQAESIRRAGGQAEVLLGDLAVSGEPVASPAITQASPRSNRSSGCKSVASRTIRFRCG